MEVIFLGTVTIPDYEESVCLLCREKNNSNLLIECCSGVLRQLKKLKIPESDINYIYISHIHGDHWLGLPWLILTNTKFYYKYKKVNPLNLICSRSVFSTIVHTTCQMFPIVEDYIEKMVKHIQIKENFIKIPNTSYKIKAIRVPHYVECFAPFIVGNSSSFLYSADTNINSNLWRYHKSTKFLIHESYGIRDSFNFEKTFGHSMPEEVIEKFKKSRFSRLYLVGFKDRTTKIGYKRKLQKLSNVFIPNDLDKIIV